MVVRAHPLPLAVPDPDAEVVACPQRGSAWKGNGEIQSERLALGEHHGIARTRKIAEDVATRAARVFVFWVMDPVVAVTLPMAPEEYHAIELFARSCVERSPSDHVSLMSVLPLVL